ncbi:Sec-independent protein translocase protein TatB [Altericroceibacterium endophyticum]|uniref:Sec-independent protein translocase protein TatB n=1 Tax=Altericroceibacterium endophyticum TaxID=1808508 RepID=A0A6I4T8A9_9SPHN|nr:Sec-independent protein translocase protein TatB [Altericroceibacterium endophyticum]MXO66492.1 twin-arginine translocase subunit TatB [Altericroceibacterium endophyticum]
MLDIGASELLIIVVVAVVVIGPKDMPLAMRTAGRWIGKMRRVSSHFRTGLDTMIREAEMEDMEKKWKEQNAKIMAEHPAEEMRPLTDQSDTGKSDGADDGNASAVAGSAESRAAAKSSPTLDKSAGAQASTSAPSGSAASGTGSAAQDQPAEEPRVPLDKPQSER